MQAAQPEGRCVPSTHRLPATKPETKQIRRVPRREPRDPSGLSPSSHFPFPPSQQWALGPSDLQIDLQNGKLVQYWDQI